MEYVRESWNLLRTPENLIKNLESEKDDKFIKEVILSLLNLNSRPEISTPLFLNYIEILFLHYPDVFLEILSNDSGQEFGLGFIRLINQVGLQFVTYINFDNQISTAKCIKNILNFSLFLTPTKDCINALMKLSSELKFPALIAFSRLYFENEIKQIRATFKDKILQTNSFPLPSLMMNRLNKSIFYDSTVKISHFHQHYYIPLILWNIIITGKSDFLSHFLSKKSLVLIFQSMVYEYVNNPSLSLAYLIIYTFPNALNENIQQIISDIKKYESESSNEEEEIEDNHFFLKSNVIEQIVTTESFTEPRPFELINSIFLYPKNILTFSEKLFSFLQIDRLSSLCEIVPYLMKFSQDVIMYLALQNQLSEFLLKLASVCENMKSDNDFCKIWFLFLHYVQSSWCQGSSKIREMVKCILEKASSEIRYFLTALLTYKRPPFDLTVGSNSTRLQNSIVLLDKLLKNISEKRVDKFNQIVIKSEQFPYFWPSILLNCICQPFAEYANLPQMVKIPNSPIVDVLFNHFMIIIDDFNSKQAFSNEKKSFFYDVFSCPDYNILVNYPITDLSELKGHIRDHILELFQLQSSDISKFNEIACIWRSWSTTSGPKKFAAEVIDVLNVLTVTISVPFNTSSIAEKLAYMFGAICEDQKETGLTRTASFSEILDIIFENFNEGRFQNQELGAGMSSFCISIISLVDNDEEFTQLFNKTFKFAQLCLQHHPFIGESKSSENERFKIASSFAVSLIRKALFIPKMQDIIIDAPYDYLVKIKDWKTLTDFFIVKARIKWMKESENI